MMASSMQDQHREMAGHSRSSHQLLLNGSSKSLGGGGHGLGEGHGYHHYPQQQTAAMMSPATPHGHADARCVSRESMRAFSDIR